MLSAELHPCRPPWWARGRHAQTILGHLLPSPPLDPTFAKCEIALPDGDRLVGAYHRGQSDTVVSFFHGLAGSIEADYMARSARIAKEAGHSVYLINHRGCGEGLALAKQPYHSGRGDDIGAAIAFARAQEPGKQQIAIGFSISGNALLCLLTGVAPGALPDAAIAVNAPIDLDICAQHLVRGFNRVYDWRFVLRLRKMLRDQHALGIPDRQQRIPLWATLPDFDASFTAPVCGFGTRENYYAQCSTHSRLAKISVPTVLLTAEDDPFVDVSSYRNAKLSPTTHLHIEKHGGHMGYIARQTPRGTRRWLDYALAHFLEKLKA